MGDSRELVPGQLLIHLMTTDGSLLSLVGHSGRPLGGARAEGDVELQFSYHRGLS